MKLKYNFGFRWLRIAIVETWVSCPWSLIKAVLVMDKRRRKLLKKVAVQTKHNAYCSAYELQINPFSGYRYGITYCTMQWRHVLAAQL
jgi:hypothetical protein